MSQWTLDDIIKALKANEIHAAGCPGGDLTWFADRYHPAGPCTCWVGHAGGHKPQVT